MSEQRFASSVLRSTALAAALVVAAHFAAAAADAQIWQETGDAGSLVSTAQVTAGNGPLTQIRGALGAPTDVDVYCIHLGAAQPPFAPLVGLNCLVIQGPNAWLFDAAGNGIASNNTCSGGSKQIIAPSTGLAVGNYYVAVSFYGYDPQSASGAMWQALPPASRAPDGPGAAGTLTGWAGTPNVQPQNPYQVFLAPGFTYCDAAVSALRSTWGSLKIHYGS